MTDDRFAAVAEALTGERGVTWGADEPARRGRFGRTALKVGGKLFAMPLRGRLVVRGEACLTGVGEIVRLARGA